MKHICSIILFFTLILSGYCQTSNIIDLSSSNQFKSLVENNNSTNQLNCSESVDFEDETSVYSNWVFSGIVSKQDSKITAYSGSYFGTSGGKQTAYMYTKNEILGLDSIKFYISKTTTNTNTAAWIIYVSNGSTETDPTKWTKDTTINAASTTKGQWTKVCIDLSKYKNISSKVCIYYKGNTAIRTIDDICLCYGSKPSIHATDITTITTINQKQSSKKGSIIINNYEGSSTLTAISNNDKFKVECDGLDYTIKYKASSSCLDTAIITFTYDTLTTSITVYGTNTYTIENLATTVSDSSVIFSWTKSREVSEYLVTINGISTKVSIGTYTANNLSANTSYSYSIIPVVNDLTCIEETNGTITTLSCSDYPKDISYSNTTNSITLNWIHNELCTAILYKDQLCNDIIQAINNVKNTVTFDNLENSKTYYAIIFSKSLCSSDTIEISTSSPYITIVEWFPDSIHVDLNSSDAATVMLEKEVQQSSNVSNYANNLFFSKYFEAAGDLKMLGIYNGTNHDISLKGIEIWGAKETDTIWANRSGKRNNFVKLDLLKDDIKSGEEMILFSVGSSADDWISDYSDYNESSYPENWYLIGKWGSGYDNSKDPDHYHLGLSFSGAYSLILVKVDTINNDTTLLDVFGAGTLLAPKHDGVYKSPNCTMDNNTYAFSTSTGEDEDGNTVTLTTNSTILVRKNIVKDGLSAVANNTLTFKTLGNDYNGIAGEWWGKSVCADINVSVKDSLYKQSCNYFSIVSTFDYNGYYISFDSISVTPLNTNHRNIDGTFTIPIPDLDTLSCYKIKVISKDANGHELSTSISRVPIMVTKNMDVNNQLFTQFTIDTCKICDVVIRDNSILSTVSNPKRPRFKNIYVYPGSTLSIPLGTEHDINHIVLRSEDDKVPFVKLNSHLNSSEKIVYFTKRITNDRYYFFSLPYDCKVSSIYFITNEKLQYGVDWQILYYDGQQRAIDNNSAVTHWKAVNRSETLKAGIGYAIAVSVQQAGWKKEVIFPMDISSNDIYVTDTITKSISITAYGAENGAYPEFTKDGLHANSVGWNFIGNPYLTSYGQLSSKNGKAVLSQDASWYSNFDDNTNLYYTIPNAGQDQTYYQDFASLYTLQPFQAMFIQAPCDGILTFYQSEVKRNSPKRISTTKSSDIIRIKLYNGLFEDYTTFLIDNDYSNKYEIGYDLLKTIQFYTNAPQIYSIINNEKLAFNAINDSVAQNIQLGTYIYNGSNNTISLSKDFDLSNLEHVYLIDNNNNSTTDLLYNDYTFITNKQFYTNSRFTISVIRKTQEDITTNNNIIYNQDNYKSTLIFDILGHKLGSINELETLPSGIYIIYDGYFSKKIFINK